MSGIPPKTCGKWFCIRPRLWGHSKCGKHTFTNGRKAR